jgi:hypothetical protein
MHSKKHASCDRRHVVMVHAIIRIVQSYDLLIQIRIINVWISTSFIIYKLHKAKPVWINLNVGPSVRLFDTFKVFIFQIIPATWLAVRCRLNYTLQVSKLRLLKFKLLPAGPGFLSNIIRGCWWSYFNSWTMLNCTVCAKVYSYTPGEYTRRGKSNQVPGNSNHVPKHFLRQMNKPSILFKRFLPSTFCARENVAPRILIPEPDNVWIE